MGRDARARARKGDAAYQGMNWIRKDKRLAIYLRDGMVCLYCGSGIEEGGTLTLDHLTPHSAGGTNQAINLITACHKCNSARGDRTVEAFAEAAAGYLDRGVRAEDILAGIWASSTRQLGPYRAQAKELLARRPDWQAALAEATTD